MNNDDNIDWQDSQHKLIFKFIESIRSTSEVTLIKGLIESIEEHFALEDKYMLEVDYPKKDIHISAHKKFIEMIENDINDQYELTDKFCKRFSTFCYDWFTNHIATLDDHLDDFMLDNKDL